jgi:hypothetical protein
MDANLERSAEMRTRRAINVRLRSRVVFKRARNAARLAPSCWVRLGEGTKHPLGDVILGAGLRFCDFFWRVLLLCESPRYSNRKIEGLTPVVVRFPS